MPEIDRVVIDTDARRELADHGLAHEEPYPDVGPVNVRIIDLAGAAGVSVTTWADPLPGFKTPKIEVSGP